MGPILGGLNWLAGILPSRIKSNRQLGDLCRGHYMGLILGAIKLDANVWSFLLILVDFLYNSALFGLVIQEWTFTYST